MALRPAVPFARPPAAMDDLFERFEAGLEECESEDSDREGAAHGVRIAALESIFEEMDMGEDFQDSFLAAVDLSDESDEGDEDDAELAPPAILDDDEDGDGDEEEEEEEEEESDDDSDDSGGGGGDGVFASLLSLVSSDDEELAKIKATRHYEIDELMAKMLTSTNVPGIIATPACSSTGFPPLGHKSRPVAITLPMPTIKMPSLNRLSSISNFKNRKHRRVPSVTSSIAEETSETPDIFIDGHKRKHSEGCAGGLPTLPLRAECLWTDEFPGNTLGLTHKLLTWHAMTRALYDKYHPSVRLMNTHPLFPYPPERPVNISLVSISFYDTSVWPHRELQYFGPGDVESIVYAEVDTFAGPDEVDMEEAAKIKSPKRNSNFERMKKMNGEYSTKETFRRMDMRGKDEKGEGRWAFVIIKGKLEKGDEGVAPWLTVAWPTMAVTRKSNCLHTLFPDHDKDNVSASTTYVPGVNPTQPAFSASTSTLPLPRRSTSASSSRSYIQPRFHLPSATSSPSPTPSSRHRRKRTVTMPSMVTAACPGIGFSPGISAMTTFSYPSSASLAVSPAADGPGISLRNDAWTVKRTIMEFGNDLGMPCVEAYRTDPAAWKGVLDVVGRGCGKVVMVTNT
ncbi:hypothetical protein P280DRAFT_271543 [Massarina eburnea CBS 473.64]|uniref:Uncharacterized protein n=1 Tax=Massarina eburnea CBS 473.64 TaxID=1395130 RepID=A0A6A6S7F5_9PLEO|nr:hypothetical protein P280DRAFT_271543 [Massarina eburnea CBS 473.64]